MGTHVQCWTCGAYRCCCALQHTEPVHEGLYACVQQLRCCWMPVCTPVMRYQIPPMYQKSHGAFRAVFQSSKYADLRLQIIGIGLVKRDITMVIAIVIPVYVLASITSPSGTSAMTVMLLLLLRATAPASLRVRRLALAQGSEGFIHANHLLCSVVRVQ